MTCFKIGGENHHYIEYRAAGDRKINKAKEKNKS